MVFSSVEFVFVFLPACLVAFFLLGRSGGRASAYVLLLASMVFYVQWSYRDLIILLGSIAFNLAVVSRIGAKDAPARLRRGALTFGVCGNLAALAYYKYAAFLADAVGLAVTADTVTTLPLGISFFTFTQIAFLVDSYRAGKADTDPIRYGLFVSYFPHLVAGPILHHAKMMPQFAEMTGRVASATFNMGMSYFAIGLFKKVALADAVAPMANSFFRAVGAGHAPAALEAWAGALAYSLQIYFDFSGYSDMAVGLSLMLGIRIPFNFNSPYKASSIIDFWRRWHMSLSQFLRDYLYIPLGGSHCAAPRRMANIMTVMTLGGLWHGANWTFLAWGCLHGAMIVINHAWRGLMARGFAFAIPRWLAVPLVFLLVTLAWVFFRAASVSDAVSILGGMAGRNGLVLPAQLAEWFDGLAVAGDPLPNIGLRRLPLLAILILFVWTLPNTQEFLEGGRLRLSALRWTDSAAWAVAVGVLGAVATFLLVDGTQFIYFNF